MRAVIYLIVGIYLLSNSLLSQKHNNAYVKIKVENGLIEGFFDASANLNVFFGIPYAKPPVDDLRWKAPQPMDNWNGVLETKKFSAHPVQIPVWGDLHTRSEKMSEDCLYLNIWAPAQADIKGQYSSIFMAVAL